jgi:hypothetical protein
MPMDVDSLRNGKIIDVYLHLSNQTEYEMGSPWALSIYIKNI